MSADGIDLKAPPEEINSSTTRTYTPPSGKGELAARDRLRSDSTNPRLSDRKLVSWPSEPAGPATVPLIPTRRTGS